MKYSAAIQEDQDLIMESRPNRLSWNSYGIPSLNRRPSTSTHCSLESEITPETFNKEIKVWKSMYFEATLKLKAELSKALADSQDFVMLSWLQGQIGIINAKSNDSSQPIDTNTRDMNLKLEELQRENVELKHQNQQLLSSSKSVLADLKFTLKELLDLEALPQDCLHDLKSCLTELKEIKSLLASERNESSAEIAKYKAQIEQLSSSHKENASKELEFTRNRSLSDETLNNDINQSHIVNAWAQATEAIHDSHIAFNEQKLAQEYLEKSWIQGELGIRNKSVQDYELLLDFESIQSKAIQKLNSESFGSKQVNGLGLEDVCLEVLLSILKWGMDKDKTSFEAHIKLADNSFIHEINDSIPTDGIQIDSKDNQDWLQLAWLQSECDILSSKITVTEALEDSQSHSTPTNDNNYKKISEKLVIAQKERRSLQDLLMISWQREREDVNFN